MSLLVSVTKKKQMSSAHYLPYHDGKCQGLHGHTFEVGLTIKGEVRPVSASDPESGMVADLTKSVNKILNHLHDEVMDHKCLNDSCDAYPTAERLALRIATEASKRIEFTPGPNRAWLSKVTVSEGPGVVAEVELEIQDYLRLRAGGLPKALR